MAHYLLYYSSETCKQDIQAGLVHNDCVTRMTFQAKCEMKCPVCNTRMTQYHLTDMDLDLCPSCDGAWFDEGELSSVLEQLLENDAITRQLKPGLAEGETRQHERQLTCPRCGMLTDCTQFSFDSRIYIDRCIKCSGVWVDKGELLAILKYVSENRFTS